MSTQSSNDVRSFFPLLCLASAAAALLGVGACGSGGSTPSSPSPSPSGGDGGTTITITASGVSPRSLTVTAGTEPPDGEFEYAPHLRLSRSQSGHGYVAAGDDHHSMNLTIFNLRFDNRCSN